MAYGLRCTPYWTIFKYNSWAIYIFKHWSLDDNCFSLSFICWIVAADIPVFLSCTREAICTLSFLFSVRVLSGAGASHWSASSTTTTLLVGLPSELFGLFSSATTDRLTSDVFWTSGLLWVSSLFWASAVEGRYLVCWVQNVIFFFFSLEEWAVRSLETLLYSASPIFTFCHKLCPILYTSSFL